MSPHDVETRLREALHEQAAGARPASDAWQRVRIAAQARRRRRLAARYSLAGLSAAAAVIGAVVLVAALRDGGGSTRIAGTEGPTRPRELVAIDSGKVVVLDSQDGHAVRTLVEGLEARGASSVAVTPDGQGVFFTRAVPTPDCEQDAVAQIVAVPAGGGGFRVVAQGQQPVVSPDGSQIAFGASDDPNGCGPPTHLAVGPADATGEPCACTFRNVVVGADLANAVPVAWDPDGFSIVVQVIPNGADKPQFFEIDPRSDQPRPTEIKLPAGSYRTSFLGRRGDRVVARSTVAGGTEVDAVDAGTGAVKEKLFELTGRSIGSLTSDASGRHLLFSTVGASPQHREEPRLWRWTHGDAQPTQLAAGGAADGNQWSAAWVADPPPAAAAPARVVAATREGNVVVLDIKSGKEVRTLATGLDTGFGSAHVAVSPDGGTAYLPHFATKACPPDKPGTTLQIANVGTDGASKPSVIADGDLPAVSGDGRMLAYVANGSDATCGVSNALVVRDLGSGVEGRWLVNPADDTWTAGPLSWSPDSRHLLVGVFGRGSDSYRIFDTASGGSLLDAPPVPLAPELAPAGYLGDTGQLVAVDNSTRNRNVDTVTLVAVDPVSGRVLRTLLTVPNAVVNQEDVTTDSSGRHLLLATRSAGGGGADTAVSLYRWSEGDHDPTQLTPKANAVFAVWLPASTRETRADTTAPRPDTIVAATDDGRIVELSSKDGGVGRVLAKRERQPDNRYETIVATSSGDVYYEEAAADPARQCKTGDLLAGDIRRVPRTGGSPEVVAHGRWPAISPDGSQLAYVKVSACDQPAQLALKDVASGAERVWSAPAPAAPDGGGPKPELTGPLAFAPDGRHVLVRVNVEPASEYRYADVTAATPIFDGPRIPEVTEQGGPFDVAFLGGTGRLAAIVADANDGSKLRIAELDLAASQEWARLVDLSRLGDKHPVRSLASDDSGRHLLYVTGAAGGRHDLNRWSRGDDKPVKIASGIVAADW